MKKIFYVVECDTKPEIHRRAFTSIRSACDFVAKTLNCEVSHTIYGCLTKGLEKDFAFLLMERSEPNFDEGTIKMEE